MKDVLLLYFKRKEGTSFKWQKRSEKKTFFFTLKTMCNICVQDRTILYIKCETLSLGTLYKMQKVIDIK